MMLTQIFSCALAFYGFLWFHNGREDNKKLCIYHWELSLHGCPCRRKADVDFVIIDITTHSASRTDTLCINTAQEN